MGSVTYRRRSHLEGRRYGGSISASRLRRRLVLLHMNEGLEVVEIFYDYVKVWWNHCERSP